MTFGDFYNILFTVVLLIVVGLLRFNVLRIPKVVRNIRFFKEVLEFAFWILVFRTFVVMLYFLTDRSLDVIKPWPATVLAISFNLDNILSGFYFLLAVAGFLLVAFNYRRIMSASLAPFLLIAFLIVLWNVFTTNALQGGIVAGFSNPISGLGMQYYHDAIRFSSVSELIGEYNQVQASLNVHSRVHPFGPNLVFFLLNSLFAGNVFWISVVVSVFSCATVFPTYLLFKELQLSEKICRVLTLIFIFLPSIVLYYGTSIDGVIALLFTTAIATFVYSLKRNSLLVALGSGLVISMALLMTFIGFFIIGVIAVWFFVFNTTMAQRRWFSGSKSLAVVLLVPAVVLLLTRQFLGFDYVESLLVASRIQNPEGFMLFSQPLNYLVTRLENAWEILLFFGPVCSVLLYRTIKKKTFAPRHNLFAMVGMSLLLIAFLAGVCDTGETARICMFIFPYLLLLIADQIEDTHRDSVAIMCWLFAQALVMQTFLLLYW